MYVEPYIQQFGGTKMVAKQQFPGVVREGSSGQCELDRRCCTVEALPRALVCGRFVPADSQGCMVDP